MAWSASNRCKLTASSDHPDRSAAESLLILLLRKGLDATPSGSSNLMKATMACPRCSNENWKSASLVYSEGTQTINSTTSASGIGVGTGGVGGAFGAAQTTGIQQTAISRLAAPPGGMMKSMLLMITAFIGFFLCIFTIDGLWLGIPSLALLFYVWPMERREMNDAIQRWAKVRMCTRCGLFYTP